MYREERRYQEASEVALRYLTYHPKSANIFKLYLNSVDVSNNDLLISIAIGRVYRWLKEHPDNSAVRDNFISFIKKRKRKDAAIIIRDISEWLKNNHNKNVKAGYLSLVLEKGSDEDARRAIEEGKKWLSETDDSLIRVPYFQIVVNRADSEQIQAVLRETAQWLDINKQDHNLRAVYAIYIAANGDLEQKRSTLEMCEMWLNKNEDDNFLLPTYLDIVESYNQQKYIEAAFKYTQDWLANPRHIKDIRVREKFLKFVLNMGTPEQIADAIKDAKKWLVQMEKKETNRGNVRIGLLNLIKSRGITNQVTEEIYNTLEWLDGHSSNTNVRAALLDLVKARCENETLRNDLFINYTFWLEANKRNKEASEVRRRFIDYITEIGNPEQKLRVAYDTEIWLTNFGDDVKVKASLNILRKSMPQ